MHRLLHAALNVAVHATFRGRRTSGVDPELVLSLPGHTVTVVVDSTSSESWFPALVSLVVCVPGQSVAGHDGPGIVTVYAHGAVMFVRESVCLSVMSLLRCQCQVVSWRLFRFFGCSDLRIFIALAIARFKRFNFLRINLFLFGL